MSRVMQALAYASAYLTDSPQPNASSRQDDKAASAAMMLAEAA